MTHPNIVKYYRTFLEGEHNELWNWKFIIPVIPVSQKLTGITYLLGSLSVTVVMFNMNIHRYNGKNLKEIKEEHIISPL